MTLAVTRRLRSYGRSFRSILWSRWTNTAGVKSTCPKCCFDIKTGTIRARIRIPLIEMADLNNGCPFCKFLARCIIDLDPLLNQPKRRHDILDTVLLTQKPRTKGACLSVARIGAVEPYEFR